MKKKINVLIIASILGLIALSIIQGYLINNTYKLKEDAFITETRRSISQIDDFSPALDSLSDLWQENFINKLVDYQFGLIKRSDVVNGLELVIDFINGTYRTEYQKKLVKNNKPYGIKFYQTVKAIVLADSLQDDTIFDVGKHRQAHLILFQLKTMMMRNTVVLFQFLFPMMLINLERVITIRNTKV